MKSNKMNAKDSHVEQREAQTELTTPTGSDLAPMGSGFRDDNDRIFYEEINGKKYEIPFDDIGLIVSQLVRQGVITGLLSLGDLEQLLKQYSNLKGAKLMYSPVPLLGLPSNQ